MKNTFKILFIAAAVCFSISVLAQAPPPPPGDPSTGGGGGPVGEGAPIDGGLGILLALGAGYGALRLYRSRKMTAGKEDEPFTGSM